MKRALPLSSPLLRLAASFLSAAAFLFLSCGCTTSPTAPPKNLTTNSNAPVPKARRPGDVNLATPHPTVGPAQAAIPSRVKKIVVVAPGNLESHGITSAMETALRQQNWPVLSARDSSRYFNSPIDAARQTGADAVLVVEVGHYTSKSMPVIGNNLRLYSAPVSARLVSGDDGRILWNMDDEVTVTDSPVMNVSPDALYDKVPGVVMRGFPAKF